MSADLSFACPATLKAESIITLGHGGGGRLTQRLLDDIFRPAFSNPLLNQHHDSTLCPLPHEDIAITTDSYVVDPIFFPGGNIGELAIIGTLNDLAMRGAKPLYITCGFILTEGLSIETLRQVVDEMAKVAHANGIAIVAGDIKVVEKTKKPALYINTTGIGSCNYQKSITPQSIQTHDAIVLSHDIGRHGLAVMGAREGLAWEPAITTDCRALWPMVHTLLESGIDIHCMRDLTRGGLASALIELAESAKMSLSIEQNKIPIEPNVQAGCEMLGLDPMYVANEGCMAMFVPQDQVTDALALLNTHKEGNKACQIGQVLEGPKGDVLLKNAYGMQRKLTLFSGEQLPRIC